MTSKQKHSDAANTNLPEEPQSDNHFRGLMRWSNMTPCFGQFCGKSSIIGRITRLVSPLKNQSCLGTNYNDSHSSRQKPTNKCPIILSPWRAKKLWKLMLAKSRFVHSFASAQEKGFSSECSPAVLDMFPLRSLVSRWEHFMKNLFTVTRFKYVYPIMWGQDEALQKPAHASQCKEIEKKDQCKGKPKVRDSDQTKKIDQERPTRDIIKPKPKAHGRRARERSESGSSDRASSFNSTLSDYSRKKWTSPKRVSKRAADRPSHTYRKRPRRVKEVRRRRSKPRSRSRNKAEKRVSRRKKPAQRKRPRASKKKASRGRKRKTKSKRR
ncbi:hypothetical protein Bpfe_009452 [Biomphalaria pfeifferi]|uniref:Uncharacterized protein n=1 Tax=Biomphalaria pfeifferi TaxID=112525 RepID=A0AAD8BV73_BIOPF|nr:hypothetical protein Bpfe_009452 [Biomphalaria pfeifferi]